jgi:hypothetical protein
MGYLVLLRPYWLTAVLLLFVCLSSLATASATEEKVVSPWTAAVRSAFVPGWGQFISGGRVKGVVSAVGVYGLIAAGLFVHQDYLSEYDRYSNAATNNLPVADEYYDVANQRYKLSRGLIFAAVGVWAYSVIDSYVSSSIRNTQIKAKRLRFDTGRINRFDMEYRALEGEIRIESVTEF